MGTHVPPRLLLAENYWKLALYLIIVDLVVTRQSVLQIFKYAQYAIYIERFKVLIYPIPIF